MELTDRGQLRTVPEYQSFRHLSVDYSMSNNRSLCQEARSFYDEATGEGGAMRMCYDVECIALRNRIMRNNGRTRAEQDGYVTIDCRWRT